MRKKPSYYVIRGLMTIITFIIIVTQGVTYLVANHYENDNRIFIIFTIITGVTLLILDLIDDMIIRKKQNSKKRR